MLSYRIVVIFDKSANCIANVMVLDFVESGVKFINLVNVVFMLNLLLYVGGVFGSDHICVGLVIWETV